MAKSRGRKFAELVAPSNGIFDAASLPTIPAGKLPTISVSKLENSTFSVNSESASLGGNITLDTGDIAEHTSAKYFTDTRADARIAAHNLLARAGGTMTGNLTFGDNVNVYFGASTDLRIYHDGTNSHIINSTGELRFTGSNFAFKSDSAKLYFGLSDDLQIYHDGTHSVIEDAGTGNLILQSNGAQVSLQSTTELYLTAANNGAVTAYHNGSAKFATTSTGIAITGLATMATGTASSKFAVGTASVHGSYDFYNNGTSYLNGAVTVDDVLNANNISILGTGILRVGTNQTWSVGVNPSSSIRLAYDGVERSITGHYTNGMSIQTNAHILRLATDGKVHFPAFTFPASDGTNGQVLQTDGSGNLTFVTGGGGAGDITAVVAGTNLTGGATSGSATVNLATNLSGLGTITSSGDFTTSGIIKAHRANSNVAAPNTANHAEGTRISFYDASATSWYAMGIESNTLWFNSDYAYKWYEDGALRMHLTGANLNVTGTISSGGNTVWHAGNDGAGSGLDADTVDGIQAASFLRSDTIDSVGTDVYHNYGPNSTWSSTLRVGGNGYTAGQNNAFASVVTTNGNLHLDAGGDKGLYLNHYSGTAGVAFGSGASGAVAWMGPDGDLWKGSADNTGSKYWHAGNDGSGSGLDADTVDGIQGASFLRSDVHDTGVGLTINGGTLNSPTDSTLYVTASNNNDWGIIIGAASGKTEYGMQIQMPSSFNYALRILKNGSEHFNVNSTGATIGGNYIWHAGNDGAASGLDADLLDGLQGSSYMGYLGMATNRDDYVNLRVVRNSGSSAGSDGMYIGYGNAGSGQTRIYGGGSTSAHVYHDGSNFHFASTGLGSVSMAGTLTITNNSIRSASTSTWDGNPGAQGKIQYHSNRWYIVSDSASNRIVQFRRDGTDVSYIDNSGNFIGNVTGTLNGISTTALVGTHNGHNRSVQAEVGALHFYADGGDSSQTNHAYALFQETGAWSNPYPDLKINYHTGIKMAANNGYDGIRFFTDYNTSSRVLQINGSSNYIFKDVWMHTDSGEGMYSSQNSMHFYPNSGQSAYSPITITGSRSSYGGIFDDYGDVNWMHDSGGNGGNWNVNFGWYFYFHRTNGCLGVAGSATSSSYGLYEQGGGIYSTGNVVAYSDRRAKENIVTISNALDKTLKLRGVFYNKIDDETKTRQVGVIAQEMKEILPEAVIYAEDTDEYGVAYGNVVGLLIESIKELKQEVDDLKKKLEEK